MYRFECRRVVGGNYKINRAFVGGDVLDAPKHTIKSRPSDNFRRTVIFYFLTLSTTRSKSATAPSAINAMGKPNIAPTNTRRYIVSTIVKT